jgi:hypothetical protein
MRLDPVLAMQFVCMRQQTPLVLQHLQRRKPR